MSTTDAVMREFVEAASKAATKELKQEIAALKKRLLLTEKELAKYEDADYTKYRQAAKMRNDAVALQAQARRELAKAERIKTELKAYEQHLIKETKKTTKYLEKTVKQAVGDPLYLDPYNWRKSNARNGRNRVARAIKARKK